MSMRDAGTCLRRVPQAGRSPEHATALLITNLIGPHSPVSYQDALMSGVMQHGIQAWKNRVPSRPTSCRSRARWAPTTGRSGCGAGKIWRIPPRTVRRNGSELEVRYQSGSGVQAELEDLAAAEQECCAFVVWTLTQQDGQPILRVVAKPETADDIASIAAAFGVV
jgi:hypothetical protein